MAKRTLHEPTKSLTESERVGPIPKGMMTRRMLKERVGITDHELRTLSAVGVIRAVSHTRQGWALYDESTIEEIKTHPTMRGRAEGRLMPSVRANDAFGHAVAYSTDDSLAVFALLRDGRSLDQIVIEVRLHPVVVAAIAKDYERLTGALIVPKSVVDRINALPIAGSALPISSPEDLLSALESSLTEHHCAVCRKRPSLICSACSNERVRSAATAARSIGAAESASADGTTG